MKPARITWCEIDKAIDFNDTQNVIIREDGTGQFDLVYRNIFGREVHQETFKFTWEYCDDLGNN